MDITAAEGVLGKIANQGISVKLVLWGELESSGETLHVVRYDDDGKVLASCTINPELLTYIYFTMATEPDTYLDVEMGRPPER